MIHQASVHFPAATAPTLPPINPNTSGLPGVSEITNMVGTLLIIGLIGCVVGLVVSAIVWAVGNSSANPQFQSRGKTGVLVSFGSAILIGGATALVAFFAGAGSGL